MAELRNEAINRSKSQLLRDRSRDRVAVVLAEMASKAEESACHSCLEERFAALKGEAGFAAELSVLQKQLYYLACRRDSEEIKKIVLSMIEVAVARVELEREAEAENMIQAAGLVDDDDIEDCVAEGLRCHKLYYNYK